MKEREEPRRDLLLILLIVPLGVLCMFLTGQQAIKLVPTWTMIADMGSNLDPNVDFAARTDPELMEPVNSNILTQPVWGDFFLTPNAIIPTRIIQTKVPTPLIQPTIQPTLVIPTENPTPLPPPPTTIVLPPPTNRPPPPPPPPPIPTDTPIPIPSADLGVTVTDNVIVYSANGTVTYIITVSNLSGSNITGATVTDNFPALLTNISWTCVGVGGAACTPGPVAGGINDIVNLPVGTSIIYTVTATVIATPSGNLVYTTTVAIPAGYVDPNGTNDAATDTDILVSNPTDLGIEITDPVDYNAYFTLSTGNAVTLNFPTVVNGDAGSPDLIYYEYRSGPVNPGVLLDWVIIEIGDGVTWYTVFYWGDENADLNTNMNFNILPDPPAPPFPPPLGPQYEGDQRIISATSMYNGTGVAIDLDLASIPQTTYPYLRITAPSGDSDGQLEIDALVALP